MICENAFCIYWDNNRCILENISLDEIGLCRSCIYIDIDPQSLNQYRLALRNKLEPMYEAQNKQK